MLQEILGTEYPDWKNTLYVRRHEDVDRSCIDFQGCWNKVAISTTYVRGSYFTVVEGGDSKIKDS